MTGRRTVLIVEDEVLIGMDMAMSMQEAGFVVSGPFKSTDRALEALGTQTPDIGLLDLNLGNGETSEKVAERLEELQRPFIFLTGYSASSHPLVKRFSHAKCLSKPVDMAAVTGLVAQSIDDWTVPEPDA
jgi:DNA-binding response OmpR family regulator